MLKPTMPHACIARDPTAANRCIANHLLAIGTDEDVGGGGISSDLSFLLRVLESLNPRLALPFLLRLTSTHPLSKMTVNTKITEPPEPLLAYLKEEILSWLSYTDHSTLSNYRSRAWILHMPQYAPFRCNSSVWAPSSRITPLSPSTMILSAF